MPYVLDEKLRPYATDRQWEILSSLAEYGSQDRAADALGCHRRLIYTAKAAVEKKAALHGYAPNHDHRHPVPPGFRVKGSSTLYDLQSGEPRIQWIKTDRESADAEAAMRVAVEALKDEVPRAEPRPLLVEVARKLLNKFIITDFHLGMNAWGKETGENWNLEIAEQTLLGCFRAMVDGAPAAHTALVAQLGDFLHADSIFPETPTSHHRLDVDGRFEKVVAVAVRVLRAVVDMALEKHESVIVLMAEGNHDISSSIWLRVMFSALYENEPRVTVDTSPLPYYAHQWGKTMLAFHHGHLRKMDNLPGIFAAQFSQMWGATEYRYADCGHYHHARVKEDHGMTVTQHRTLAPRDSYAARGGYHAERKTQVETYHQDHGLVASTHVTPEMMAA